ncbi:MAG: hypothetical protein ABH877_05705 [bacterium]
MPRNKVVWRRLVFVVQLTDREVSVDRHGSVNVAREPFVIEHAAPLPPTLV